MNYPTTLTELTKPYLSTYECKTMILGTQNLLEDFDEVTIELAKEGYILRFSQNGVRQERKGTYEFDEKTHRFTSDQTVGFLENGELTFGRQIGKQYFFARFVEN